MNKTLFKHTTRFVAVAAAAAMFTSCAKDEFTEAQALELELKKLRTEDSIKVAREKQQRLEQVNLLRYKRSLDSLDALNAGGRVFYTVSVVDGNNSVFASGRSEGTESPISNATVTASQYGATFTATGSNGVYAFPELRSGEVTVTISATGKTPMTYIANLTPDRQGNVGAANSNGGAVKNGDVVYVGNVIPLFSVGTNNGAGSTADLDNGLAIIRGKAWIDSDLTNRTTVTNGVNGGEEEIPAGASMTATIDTERDGAFWKRYMAEANNVEEGVGSTKSGFIQRVSYGRAVTRATVTAAGDYTMVVPATGAGLPVRMEFDEFATNRTFFRSGAREVRRFLYGPNVTADAVPDGRAGWIGSFTAQAFQTAAAGTATYTTTAEQVGDAVAEINDGTVIEGLFLRQPSVAFTAAPSGGTTATGKLTRVFPETTESDTDDTHEILREYTLAINEEGEGYTTAPTVTVTRNDVKDIGFGYKRGATSNGIAKYIQIDRGGFGFNFPAALTTEVNRGFTGYPPQIKFTADAAGTDFLPAITNPATASVFNADMGGVGVDGFDRTIGTVRYITVGNEGSGYPVVSANTAGGGAPFVFFTYGQTRTIPSFDVEGEPLFLANGLSGLRFNDGDYDAVDYTGINIDGYSIGAVSTGAILTPTGISFPNGYGAEYTFVPTTVPQYEVNGAAAAFITAGRTEASFTTSVYSDPTDPALFGRISEIEISSAGTYPEAVGNEDGGDAVDESRDDLLLDADYQGIALIIRPNDNGNNEAGLRATAYTSGTGISTYEIDLNQNDSQYADFMAGFTTYTEKLGGTDVDDADVIEAIQNSDVIVIFDKPSAKPFARAFGIPVQNVNGGGIVGVYMISGGAGYTASDRPRMRVIPNPFRHTENSGEFGDAGEYIFNYEDYVGTDAFDEDRGIDFDGINDFESLIDSRIVRTSATTLETIPAQYALTFTLSSNGAGYTNSPEIYVTGGDHSFPMYQVGAGNIKFNGATGAIASITAVEGDGTLGVPAGNTGKWETGVTYNLVVVDRLSAALTTAVRTAGFQPSVSAAGVVTGFSWPTGTTTTSVVASLPTAKYRFEPTFTISGGTTNATGVFRLEGVTGAVDNNTGKIVAMSITSGGAGFGYMSSAFMNLYDQSLTTGGPSNSGAKNFYVVGGKVTGTQTQTAFDAFSGITYVRDIHYGTGKELQ
jgi:hypothetical protein